MNNPSKRSSEAGDETDDNYGLMEEVFSNYGDKEIINSSKAKDILQDILTPGAVICIICMDSVKRQDKIWSCPNCHCIVHLDCIIKWATDDVQVEKNKRRNLFCIFLSCPKCRTETKYYEGSIQYLCFCGKVKNPMDDSCTVPHSCGLTCGKELKPNCDHTCCLLCHPGPCPPCPKTVSVSCCCSKSKTAVRKCSDKNWVCDRKCEKILSCKIHSCDALCHKGECQPCSRQSERKCRCGNKSALKPCSDQKWQCEKVCIKPLECGIHNCLLICHEGSCRPYCPHSGVKTCPCKKKYAILPCTERVKPCGDNCDKPLECKLHRCGRRCHYGPCEKCLQMRVMKCRCGLKEKSVPCGKEFICDSKCKKLRSCGKHFCHKKCCRGKCPPCELLCGKTINCGIHQCTSLCHSGSCWPCREKEEFTCNCGMTKKVIFCGSKKSATPPKCSYNCRLPADCHHKERQKHECHFGPCPPCSLTCEKPLKCGHLCLRKCHSAVPTKIKTKPNGLFDWDLTDSSKMALVSLPCPPCNAKDRVIGTTPNEYAAYLHFDPMPTSYERPIGRGRAAQQWRC